MTPQNFFANDNWPKATDSDLIEPLVGRTPNASTDAAWVLSVLPGPLCAYGFNGFIGGNLSLNLQINDVTALLR
ncbi:MAG: hypothetical protein ACFCBW_14635 [Candidatus Competibacterales bacterium]